MPESLITVGVIVRNEEAQLSESLAALARCHGRPLPVEIIVVDNASTDGTALRARDFLAASGLRGRVHRRELNHMAEARNDVVRLAAGEWIAFTDADCRPRADWLEPLIAELEKSPGAAAAGGGNSPPEDHPFRRGWDLLSSEKTLHTGSVQARAALALAMDVPHLSTSHVLYRRAHLLEAGGFRAADRVSGEDLDLSYRLRARGRRLIAAATAPVEHHVARTWRGWLAKCRRDGAAQWPVLLRHGRTIDRPRRRALILILTAAGASVVCPPLWILGTVLQGAWIASRADLGKPWAGEAKAVAWVMLTQQVYAWSTVAGFFTALRFRKDISTPAATPL